MITRKSRFSIYFIGAIAPKLETAPARTRKFRFLSPCHVGFVCVAAFPALLYKNLDLSDPMPHAQCPIPNAPSSTSSEVGNYSC
ncbi:MAG: hypothetical protein V7L04_08630 [Nostoc sp.]|uniref:hypothetical protein n=1 Tax=Nostoc sp. TaxID=1180 RepID=UPI002FF59F01